MKHNICAFILVSIMMALPLPTLAGNVTPEASSDQFQSGTDEIERFFDSFMNEELAELNIPGAAAVVVKDGEIILSEGYGFADVNTQLPVNPAATVFRVGSVSKLFTATAVMQLVERGELDLHTDVNLYLTAFQIPDTYAEPITLYHLLTHTAGFEDRFIGISAQDEDDLGSIADFLRDAMPNRVTAPGEVHSYNNYGFTLAGYIVEKISGMPFEEYVDRHIFQPLGMSQSTFAQPLPPGRS